jgi:uroporphyrinogen-III synthase
MSTGRPIVFLFRSGEEADPYEKLLDAEGFEARSIPVLQFELLNDESLRRTLERPKDYDGIVVTSPRAVDALADAISWLPSENMLWHAKAVFAVGPRTAEAAREIGFEPVGEDSGSAENLAAFISRRHLARPLLFLSGDRRRGTLPDVLKEAGIGVEEVCVYRTVPRTDLDLRTSGKPDWAVFFSPSGLEAVESARGLDLHAISIAAIGETTAEALREAGYHVRATAARPTPSALITAMREPY